MREKTCCFSGHRQVSEEDVRARLKHSIIRAIDDGYVYFKAGGATGFDTLAALTVLELKKEHPNIKLILVLPCVVKTDELISKNCDEIVYTSDHYYRGCMHKRNRQLVENSSLCICYLKEKTGGTAYTVNYAKEQGLKVINLVGDDIDA